MLHSGIRQALLIEPAWRTLLPLANTAASPGPSAAGGGATHCPLTTFSPRALVLSAARSLRGATKAADLPAHDLGLDEGQRDAGEVLEPHLTIMAA